ncbi:hypothetical protein [Brevundimonas sp. GCM10030266]|uniref:hypothetical protein n=1 Tax=Brevundimonas sp. GCM10030266 TaxID=3273386 RepID=UPI003616BF8F
MRLIALAPAALLLALGACATTGDNVSPPPSWFNTSGPAFEGWAKVEGDEIRLYETRHDPARGFPSDCVSAALPRPAQETVRDVSGRKVRVTGRAVAWADRDGGETWNWQGSRIANLCSRDIIILGDRIEVLQ